LTVRWSPRPSASSGPTLPQADDLLAGLQRVAEATRDGPGGRRGWPDLVHEDGLPRWVAATDAAMELLAQIQHDFGEGPASRRMPRTGRWGPWMCTAPSRELEVARLQQALTGRVWTEQAKGVLAATRGTDPEVAFQQLRARARASSRRLAELAREVVQDAQRQRLAALALEDVRVQEADLAQRRRA
jgi:ANTAR domain